MLPSYSCLVPCMVAFVSSTVAAASAMHFVANLAGWRSSAFQQGTGMPFKFLFVTDRSGGAAQKGHSHGVSVILQGTSFSLQRAPASTVPRAEHVQQLSSRLMFPLQAVD